MTVEKDVTRKCVNISWDTEIVQGETCTIEVTNVDTGGKGGPGEQKNDGFFPLTYPQDFVGASEIHVTGSEGGVDTGTITVGNYLPVEPGEPGAPPVVDHTLPGDLPEPDNTLPGDQPEVDHELPGDQPEVEHH